MPVVRSGSWPCKNGLKGTSVLQARTGSVSGRDRIYQRLDPDNVDDPCQVIGQNRESHLGGYFWKCFGEEVRRSHSGLHRADAVTEADW